MAEPGTVSPLGRFFSSFTLENTPADLVAVYLWTGLAALSIYAPVIHETPLRVILALPMVLFFPGYALIAALFPGRGEIDGLERLALSFGLSIAVVPLIGLVLNYTPFGIRLDPVVTSLVLFTLFMAAAAQYRRAGLPRGERFEVPFGEMWVSLRAEFFPREGSAVDRALSAILLFAIVAAVAATVYVVVVPKEGEKFTEFYILGKEGKAADYPTDLRTGQPESIIIGVGNHEYRNVTYFVELHFVDQEFDPATNTSSVLSMERLLSFPVTLAHNTTYQAQHSFLVNSTSGNQLKFLLFRDEVPPDSVWGAERINQSYRDLHLWVRVRQGS
ncbi:MAG TPA: DUF1616 domain-containing protein [Methanolinea sp.]|nr:DUF1616 domain-containing protein [Methanolinea sp.]HNQ30130.1 DUF1616 domain-containing protein [Methanolinea sp.]